MKTKYSVSALLAALALVVLSVPVPAFSETMDMSIKEHRESHGHMMAEGHLDKMGDMMGMCSEHASMMGLSDDQVSKMKPAEREIQKKQARYKADVKIAEIELTEVMEVKDFNLEKATIAAKKIADIKTAHNLEMLKAMKDMRTMITDEQFTKMKKMMSMKPSDKRHEKKMHKKSSKTTKGEDK
jgi:Spy/CpxP family protein refolding chaperone